MKYKEFIFEKYSFDSMTGEAVFCYSIDNKLKFKEVLYFPIKGVEKNIELIDKILFNIHLAGGLSYWKTYCPQKIVVKSGELSKTQAKFWEKLYYKGLGQFYFENKLDPNKLKPNFPYENVETNSIRLTGLKDNLLPWGGGKDSIVSAEILRKAKKDFTLFSVRESIPQKQTAKIANKKLITVDRKLSPNLKALQKKDAYIGHVPITAYYSFIEILVAVLYGFKNVVLSNEKSSDYGNIKYKGLVVNHQYSKSYEFEKDFSKYLAKYITPSIKYFSLLRNWYEIKIAKEFSKCPQYFQSFSSCNLANFKIDKSKRLKTGLWCNSCPKCAFVFVMLSAFLPKKEILKIFKKDLFDDKKLENTFLDLLGLRAHKPLECVGRKSEVKQALKKIIEKGEFKDSYFIKKIDDKKLVILGLGVEGQSVLRFMRGIDREKKITIADSRKLSEFDSKTQRLLKKDKNFKLCFGKKYLDCLKNAEIIVKSPGISIQNTKEIQQAQKNGAVVTSAVNLFLEQARGPVIGITGTKGKSTTSSLIYKILKTAGKKVYFGGNIGKPILDLLKYDSKNTYFIVELSSYQLENISKKPEIVLITSFFKDHLDYHGGVEKYFQAKMNIIGSKNKVIYNANFKVISDFLNQSNNKNIYSYNNDKNYIKNGFIFVKNAKILPVSSIKIPGQHNQENVLAACVVTKDLKINSKTIERAVKGFKSLEHRMQKLGKFKNIVFYNDSASVTPESTIEAIKALKNINTIILGGLDRGYDFKRLAQVILESKIKNVALFPNSDKALWSSLEKVCAKNKKYSLPKKKKFSNMKDCVKWCFEITEPGSICLLSPASPSYLSFKNFKDRGEQYTTRLLCWPIE